MACILLSICMCVRVCVYLELNFTIIVLVDLANHEVDLLLTRIDGECIHQLCQLTLGDGATLIAIDEIEDLKEDDEGITEE